MARAAREAAAAARATAAQLPALNNPPTGAKPVPPTLPPPLPPPSLPPSLPPAGPARVTYGTVPPGPPVGYPVVAAESNEVPGQGSHWKWAFRAIEQRNRELASENEVLVARLSEFEKQIEKLAQSVSPTNKSHSTRSPHSPPPHPHLIEERDEPPVDLEPPPDVGPGGRQLLLPRCASDSSASLGYASRAPVGQAPRRTGAAPSNGAVSVIQSAVPAAALSPLAAAEASPPRAGSYMSAAAQKAHASYQRPKPPAFAERLHQQPQPRGVQGHERQPGFQRALQPPPAPCSYAIKPTYGSGPNQPTLGSGPSRMPPPARPPAFDKQASSSTELLLPPPSKRELAKEYARRVPVPTKKRLTSDEKIMKNLSKRGPEPEAKLDNTKVSWEDFRELAYELEPRRDWDEEATPRSGISEMRRRFEELQPDATGQIYVQDYRITLLFEALSKSSAAVIDLFRSI